MVELEKSLPLLSFLAWFHLLAELYANLSEGHVYLHEEDSLRIQELVCHNCE